MTHTRKLKLWQKIALIVTTSILSLILIAAATVYGIFFNELNALMSLKKINDNGVYKMSYNNNYYFDDFLKQGGVKNDTELLNFIMNKLLKGMGATLEIPDLGCSSFTADTDDGEHLYGRNFDFDDDPFMILKTSPSSGYKSVSTVNLGFFGFHLQSLPESLMDKFTLLAAPYLPMDGMNEKGVSMSVNQLYNYPPTDQNTDKPDITTTTMIRLVLDKADSVQSALELIARYDLHDSGGSPFHYQIADATGDSAIVEYVNQEMRVIRKTGVSLYQTNFYFSIKQDEVYCTRYKKIEEKMAVCGGVMTKDEAVQLLDDVRSEWTDGGTQWSIVYNLDQKTAEYYFRTNYDQPYIYKV